MKNLYLTLSCGLLGMPLIATAIPPRSRGQVELTNKNLVIALRLLNTEEYSYQSAVGRFADLQEMLTFLRKTPGILSRSPIDLENPKPYELAITTSSDGMHYQVTLQRPSDMNDKTTWCKTAAFTDDRGVIFVGSAIGCEASTQY